MEQRPPWREKQETRQEGEEGANHGGQAFTAVGLLAVRHQGAALRSHAAYEDLHSSVQDG